MTYRGAVEAEVVRLTERGEREAERSDPTNPYGAAVLTLFEHGPLGVDELTHELKTSEKKMKGIIRKLIEEDLVEYAA